jgi:hypothetical protein
VAFTKTQDRLAEVLTILRDDLIPWARADAEASEEAGAVEQAERDSDRVRKLKLAERLIEECWK